MAMNRAQLLLLFVVLMLGSGASAAAAAELSPKADDCSAALLNLSACLSFVEKGAGPKAPEKGCCPSLAGLVDSNPFCLCQLLSTSDVFGIQIDAAKALTLPSICRLHTPPVSLCSVLGIPVPSPAAEPSGSPAPGAQMAAPPSEGSDGGLTAGVNSLMGLLAIVSQAAVLLF